MGEKNCNWRGGMTSLQAIIRNSAQAKNCRQECFERDNWESVLSGSNGNIEHHHLTAVSALIKQNKINKDNWVSFKDILFDLGNTVTLTKKEHNKFHSLYGKISTPEQFKEFRQQRRL